MLREPTTGTADVATEQLPGDRADAQAFRQQDERNDCQACQGADNQRQDQKYLILTLPHSVQKMQ